MGTPFLQEFKGRASFFFKEKIKTVRLALTDVTPAQLLTEEAINGDSRAPDTCTMASISRAAFEVDDYWRIVDILHKRLLRFDRKNWRASYKAIILLEHLLTHGPQRVAEEFQTDKDVIREMRSFQYVDEKGFNWGSSVGKKSEWILKLLDDRPLLKEERARARKLTHGIKGFGSFCLQRPSSSDGSLRESSTYGRCNSHFNANNNQEDELLSSNENTRTGKTQETCEDVNSLPEKPAKNRDSGFSIGEGYSLERNHSFCDNEDQTKAPLLSPLR
ncbi:hypothetical protein F0562_031597 [Nyssa sinensis]|uniref:ENTH domain-containing protein n=1 Tax=Nyssa sinensis TaxID=561372 RepID=A0A5J5AVA5_9ASTE|nr:hypothetical protein F0562_031597 [Nyssa sinensis]